jgi:hypothetical protein
LGRIKFKVKDFRTDTQPANIDLSPRKTFNHNHSYIDDNNDDWEEFSEEAVEIDCGVVDLSSPDVCCKICYSSD